MVTRRDFQFESSRTSLYRSLAVPARRADESSVETVDTRQQETIDNDRAFDLLIDLSFQGMR
jgi:hypothetical protein